MGFFGRKKVEVPPHPRREPRIDLPLTVESVRQVFADCVDFPNGKPPWVEIRTSW